MTSALVLIVIVAIAYLATHVAFDWIARRLMIVSGAEYLVLGILLGPQVTGLLDARALQSFAPLITLATSWIGASVGAELLLQRAVLLPARTYRLAFTEAIGTVVFVTAVLIIAIGALLEVQLGTALVPALGLGAIAVASTPFAAGMVAQRIGQRGPIIEQLEVTAVVDAVVAIATIGILLSIERPALHMAVRAPTPTEWAVITVAIGVIGGALFHLFLGAERKIDRLFIALAGSLILACGAAAYLELSPVFVAMLVAAMLVNTSGNGAQIKDVIAKGQRPFYFVLLIFAGALWQPTSVNAVLIVALFLAARVAGKVASARLGARFNDAFRDIGRGWGWGLIGQGGIALAIAIDYRRHDAALYPNVVFTAAVVSVLLTDLLSARVAHTVITPYIVDRGEA